MKRVSVLIILIALAGILKFLLSDYPYTFFKAQTTISFGFLLIVGYLLSDLLTKMNLPRITAYLLTGILFGPFLLNFISIDSVNDLSFIQELALCFIAMIAGGELHLSLLASRKRTLIILLFVGSIFVFTGVTFSWFVLHYYLPIHLFKHLGTFDILIIASIFGAISIARSPSSAVAVINETQSKGPFTEAILAVTVVADMLVLPVFALVCSISKHLRQENAQFDFTLLGSTSLELTLSIGLGIIIGYGMYLYFKHIGVDKTLFILGVAFGVSVFSKFLSDLIGQYLQFKPHMEPMLICMTAGFVLQNFTPSGKDFIHAMEKGTLPVYVLFFAHTGAALNLEILKQTWFVALMLVLLRSFFLVGGSWLSLTIFDRHTQGKTLYGWSFITQAGVSFGLVNITSHYFPEWCQTLGTVLIAAIIINQLIGPVTMKISLERSGEANTIKSNTESP